MAIQALLYAVVLLSTSISSPFVQPSDAGKPNFAFSWSDGKDTFVAGDAATIKVKVLGDFDSSADRKRGFCPTFSVNGKDGNSTFVSGLGFNFGEDLDSWCIMFTPIMVGVFNVLITEDYFGVLDSSLHYYVNPGPMHPAVSVVSWMDSLNEFEAGTRAELLIIPKDAYGNIVPYTSTELNSYTFNVSASFTNGSAASVLSVTSLGWNIFGYLRIEFIAATAGDLLLNIEREEHTLRGSPLYFKVKPGSLDISRCVAKWRFGISLLQLFSVAEIFIYQLDEFENLVPGLYPFDAELIERGTNLTIPVADLLFREISPGIQQLSFTVIEAGDFLLYIYDAKHNKSISGTPYYMNVFVGYCDGSYGIVNGSGLNTSVAGEKVKFSVYLKDRFQYPSPVELGKLQVDIVHDVHSHPVLPAIYPIQIINGTTFPWEQNVFGDSNLEIMPVLSHEGNTNLAESSLKLLAYAYEVVFTPENSGSYDIFVSCGNIMLNGGLPFKKEVRAGKVNASLSGITKYATKVQKQTKNEIVVQLMDSFYNPVVLQQSKLNLEMGSINNTGFISWIFVDNSDGSYTSHYLVKDVGTYEICASFDGYRFLPCPFGVNAYSGEYFPKACDDLVTVWEDESVSFDVLANDYFAGGNASIIEFSHPHHGSLLQTQKLFRYTPFKGLYGNDSFTYTISDINGNVAMASVNISILSIPPQFVSFPSQLQAVEDVISSNFGSPGFEIIYPNLMENVSLTLSAQFGTISLSPMLMQFGQPEWNSFSVIEEDSVPKTLTLAGHEEAINIALQSIQYIGDENFYGKDTVKISARNNNGVNDLNVSVVVHPVNDPPFIIIPEYIILEEDRGNGALISDHQRDKLVFLIGDPDFDSFAGEKSQFLVSFSVEVASGMLEVSLPADLINTTELKLKNSYQWQPLQTFVTISKHFLVKAKGLRFVGTIGDCNCIIQQLKYHDDNYGTVLTVTVNDMGNYGCFPDCAGNMSKPLFVKAQTNLIRRRATSSKVGQVLGSAIIIEFIMVLSLGVALLFFTCKCAVSLVCERSGKVSKKNTTPGVQSIGEQMTQRQSRERAWRKSAQYSSSQSGNQMREASATSLRSFFY